LSNGLWQFDTSIKDRPGYDGKQIERVFYVDVSPAPNVKPEDAAYPFELNRQNFSQQAGQDFQKIFNYITAIYGQLDLAASVKKFSRYWPFIVQVCFYRSQTLRYCHHSTNQAV
jgi:hypothetical protein